MLITRKQLPRRTFLKGMGATIALPMLDAMTPALGAFGRAAAKAPLRLGFAYVPNGITMADWTPTGTGTAFELSRVMKPMEPFRQDAVVLSGLARAPGQRSGGDAGKAEDGTPRRRGRHHWSPS